jgi:hypothetical protein
MGEASLGRTARRANRGVTLMKTSNVLIAAIVGALLSACGPSPARFKVTQMNSANGDSLLFTYNGNKLATVKVVKKDGTVRRDLAVTYKDNDITSITSTRGSGTPWIWTVAYLDGKLSKLSSFDPSNTNNTISTSYTYTDGRVTKGASASVSGTGSMNATVDYTYTDGRLTHTTSTTVISAGSFSETSTSTADMSYDSKNLLTSMQTRSGNSSAIGTFAYDEQGRLKTITADGSTYNYEYTEEKLTRVIVTGNNADVITYTYDQGDSVGFVPNAYGVGAWFDLSGQMLPFSENLFSLTHLTLM